MRLIHASHLSRRSSQPTNTQSVDEPDILNFWTMANCWIVRAKNHVSSAEDWRRCWFCATLISVPYRGIRPIWIRYLLAASHHYSPTLPRHGIYVQVSYPQRNPKLTMDGEKYGLPGTVIDKGTSAADDRSRPGEAPEDVEGSPHRYLTGWRLALVTVSLALCMFLTGVDGSVIGVATPGITTSFHAIDDLAWYGSGYMLPHTILHPILGVLCKSFNARYVFLTSIVIFEAGSCLCAAAPTSTSFIIGRVIAGCGAAGLLQGTLAIVGLSVPKKKVPLYYAYVLSVQGVSACTAPIFGGTFADKVSWRWCFWM